MYKLNISSVADLRDANSAITRVFGSTYKLSYSTVNVEYDINLMRLLADSCISTTIVNNSVILSQSGKKYVCEFVSKGNRHYINFDSIKVAS